MPQRKSILMARIIYACAEKSEQELEALITCLSNEWRPGSEKDLIRENNRIKAILIAKDIELMVVNNQINELLETIDKIR